MSLLSRLATLKPQDSTDETSQPITKGVPPIVDDFLGLLREVGIPPMVLGAMRHGMKGASEEKIRELCARVGIGMFNIYAGGDVRESLDPEALVNDQVIRRMLAALKGEAYGVEPEEVEPEEEPLALEA